VRKISVTRIVCMSTPSGVWWLGYLWALLDERYAKNLVLFVRAGTGITLRNRILQLGIVLGGRLQSMF
jgi:hypothetical protein